MRRRREQRNDALARRAFPPPRREVKRSCPARTTTSCRRTSICNYRRICPSSTTITKRLWQKWINCSSSRPRRLRLLYPVLKSKTTTKRTQTMQTRRKTSSLTPTTRRMKRMKTSWWQKSTRKRLKSPWTPTRRPSTTSTYTRSQSPL